MAATPEVKPAPTSPRRGPESGRALGAGAVKLVRSFLTLREGSIVVVTLVTFAYFAISANNFVQGNTFKSLLPYFAPLAIIAAGEVFVMILGEIDLSVGAWVGIASFVATLGMLFTLDGLSLIISHSTPVQVPGTGIGKITNFAQVFGGGTYSELIWALAFVVVLQLVLSFTRWGLYTVSTGGNRLGAAEAGIRTRMIIMRNFILAAGLAGFTGILEVVRTTSATPDPSGSNTLLLQVVAAAIIGGTLMTGGDGTIVGALIGALFLGILTEGLTIKGVNANYLNLYLGIAILIAMTLNVVVRRVRTGSGRG
ncbi:MAG: ABC transporter permease [Actinobacteria bacterium]|nr:MAG: ABC transporter permease [Actinomycetota bacterium]